MKTIKERARDAAWQIFEETILSENSVDRVAEIIEEKINEQKAIDDSELSKLKSSWGNETRVNRRYYIKGYRDAVEKSCEWLKNNLREYGIILLGHWESDFRKAMEE